MLSGHQHPIRPLGPGLTPGNLTPALSPHLDRIQLAPWLRWGVYAVLALTVAYTIYSAALLVRARPTAEYRRQMLATYGVADAMKKKLAPRFVDSGGSLLADPPTDPAHQVNPPELWLGHIVEDSTDNRGLDWHHFAADLARATGRPVETEAFDTNPEDLAKLRNGRFHLVVLHAAEVPYLVNNFGFIPVAVLADDAGVVLGHQMMMIVPTASPIREPADLKGRTLTCVGLASVTGYRAPVAYLLETLNMRPVYDYNVTFSESPRASIKGVAAGQIEVAAVSDTKVGKLEERGEIARGSVRVIYESPVIPRYVIGYFYNLQPALAKSVVAATLAYTPDEHTDVRGWKWKQVNYRRDLKSVRLIDDCFETRFVAGPAAGKHPDTKTDGKEDATQPDAKLPNANLNPTPESATTARPALQ